jgi:cytochrome b pre-mRNA-processing protein 3
LFSKAPLPSKAGAQPERASFWGRFARRPRDRDRLLPLYEAVVARARDPFWYREGQVPDSVDGRFDMLAAFMALVLIRFEIEPGDAPRQDMVLLTETFIADMDESLHQIGIGDYVVGKHVGRMMGALGGRLTAFREAVRDRDFAGPVRRNIFHEAPPSQALVDLVAARLERFDAALLAAPYAELAAGQLPPA